MPSLPAVPASIPWHRRLEARVIVGVTIVAGLSLAAVVAVTNARVTQYALERSASDLDAARQAFSRLVDTRTQFAAGEVRLIVEQPVFQTAISSRRVAADTPTINALAADYCGKLHADVCVVTDADGKWLGRAGDASDGAQNTLAPGITAAREGRGFDDILTWGDDLFLTVAEPAIFGGSEVIGTFTVGFRLDDDVASALALMARSDVTFVCAADRLCGTSLHGAERQALVELLAHNPRELGSIDAPPMLRTIGAAAFVGGEYTLRPGAPASATTARLLLLQDWAPFETTLSRLHTVLFWVGVLIFGTAVAGTLVFGRRLTRPLRDLASAANELASGDWNRRMPLDGPAEARVMAEAFNQMTVTLRQREDQLRQAQKMEAIGRLAGGVAHDFNNLLTGILGYADLVLKQLPDDHALRGDIEGIRKAGRSAATLTRDLLAFSRKQVLQPVVLDLNEVLTSTETLLRRLLGEDIELELRLAKTLDPVTADRTQIEHSLLNLAANARDAMPQGGRVVIETLSLAGRDLRRHGRLPPGSGAHVLLRVSDTGQGITDEVRAHLFEPFFTTKAVGKGTGLGLASVYGIVQQSAGQIWVDSEAGRGATFTIALPAVSHAPARVEARADHGEAAPRGSETILLVEDNESVRDMTQETLTRFGYRVIAARNGAEALRMGAGQLDAIALVVTDLVMPIMGGRELARRLKAERRDLKIIFTSGYAADALGPQNALEPGTPFVQKPFTPAVLCRTVRDVLDRPLRMEADHVA